MLKVYTYTPEDRFGSNCYILESMGEYIVIDPSCEPNVIKQDIPDIDAGLKAILLTHCHFDHILSIDSWTSICDNVFIGLGDGEGLSDPLTNCYLGFMGIRGGYFGKYCELSDGETLKLGDEKIRVIACPGHTIGGVAFRTEGCLFSGDTMFAGGGYGRCDLPGGDIDTLERSLIRLITHETDCTVYPGHGPKTTLNEFIQYYM